MKRLEFKLPKPLLVGSSYKFWRSQIEHEKARLTAQSMKAPEPEYCKPEIDSLVTLAVVAKEFALSTRTLMRRIKTLDACQDEAA
jgi:hypothetical protein